MSEEYAGAMNRDAKELLDLSLTTVTRMQDLVEDILRYTRIVGQEAELSVVDLNEIVAGVLGDLAGEIKESGAKVDTGPLPSVMGHANQLRMLFRNLVSNALKFRKPGTSPTVEIKDASVPTDRLCTIAVTDDGIGIPAESQDRIFTMFQRLHLQDDYGGTGLGLAICRRVAISHEGDISVRSEPGQGSTFTVSLKRS